MKVGEHREELVGRVRYLAGGVGALLALVATAYFFAQVVHGARYRELAENNRLRRLTVEAPRGIIEDRHGRVLVENLPSLQPGARSQRAAPTSVRACASRRRCSRVPVAELAGVLAR
jgi:cell division protein FtsI/penicillin-binding protein 2